MSLVYFASPYSKYKGGKEEAFRLACEKAAELMDLGANVFCPIAHSHPIELTGKLTDVSHDFWLKQDFAILKKCDFLYVYMMPGWRESHGVEQEIVFAQKNKIPIIFVEFGEVLDDIKT